VDFLWKIKHFVFFLTKNQKSFLTLSQTTKFEISAQHHSTMNLSAQVSRGSCYFPNQVRIYPHLPFLAIKRVTFSVQNEFLPPPMKRLKDSKFLTSISPYNQCFDQLSPLYIIILSFISRIITFFHKLSKQKNLR